VLTSYFYDASHRLARVRVDLTPENGADAVFFDTTYLFVRRGALPTLNDFDLKADASSGNDELAYRSRAERFELRHPRHPTILVTCCSAARPASSTL
jgi:hypothetical protein